jgi:Peptidase family M1 domain
MKKTINVFAIIFLIGFASNSFSQKYSDQSIGLKTINYNLDIHVDYDNEKLVGLCQMTVFNVTDQPIQQIPLLLYRLMKVKSIKDENGMNISFNQEVVSYEDWEVLQVNFIQVSLEKAISKNTKKTITIEYDGYLLGYSETGMNYIKDRIDKDFTILRPDCRAYPQIGYPSWKSNRSSGLENFDYTIKLTVPDSFIVANGGKFIDKIYSNNSVIYSYKNIKPAWRIDVAISKYSILESNKIKIFFFPEDSIGAKRVYEALTNTFNLYTKCWGDLKDFEGFSVIEIPDGWGSQADVTSIIQTASAFKDEKQLHQLYHEVSHLWNVKINDKFSPRWNEGLATFIEYLTIEKLENRESLNNVTKWFYTNLKEEFTKNPNYMNIPLIKFGEENIQGLSYSMGMLLFQVLYNLVGEEEFNKIMGLFYQKFHQTGATTEEFIEHAIQISNFNLTKFFDDWFWGTKYCDYIIKNLSIDEIVSLYRKN